MTRTPDFTDLTTDAEVIHTVSCKVSRAPLHRARCRHDLVGTLLEPRHLWVVYFRNERVEIGLEGPAIDPWTPLEPAAPSAPWVICRLEPEVAPDWVTAFVRTHRPASHAAALAGGAGRLPLGAPSRRRPAAGRRPPHGRPNGQLRA